MNNCLLFVLLKNFNISSSLKILLRFSRYSQIYEKYHLLKKQLNQKKLICK